jgi:acylphosphatase
MTNAVLCKKVRIRGRVQGVWFRGWTVEQALQRHLDGWVRNRLDGSVEAVISGPVEMVEEMITACKSGPLMARVDEINTEDEEATPPDPGFTTRETA